MDAGAGWWAVGATLFSAASLVAVVWQVIRFEATQPALGWAITTEPSGIVTNGWAHGTVSFRPVGPIRIHEVEPHGWGQATIEHWAERARMDCDSMPLVVTVRWRAGAEAYAGFSWLEPSLIRRRPVRQAIRVRLPDGRIEKWRWYRVWRPRRCRQGNWRPWKVGQPRRTFVPDMWGLAGTK